MPRPSQQYFNIQNEEYDDSRTRVDQINNIFRMLQKEMEPLRSRYKTEMGWSDNEWDNQLAKMAMGAWLRNATNPIVPPTQRYKDNRRLFEGMGVTPETEASPAWYFQGKKDYY